MGIVEVADETIGDADLVARIVAGDDKAFSELFRRHSRYIARVVYRLLGDDSELDDLVQDTFVTAADSLSSIRNPDKVRSWLVTIAVRNVRRRLRQRTRRRWLLRDVATCTRTISDPADRARVDALYQALDSLPSDLRLPWVLHRIEGEKLEEVAAACEVSLATVKRRIADAEARIDRRLHEG